FNDRNRSRSRRLLVPTNNTTSSSTNNTTTTTSSSTNRRSPQRSTSLCKPNHHRPTITQRPQPENQSPTLKSTTSHDHQENHRVDVLTQRTKDALLKVEKLKIRRVVSSKVTSGEKKTTVERKSQVAAMCEVEEQKPISILKRKSGTCTLPVTFSPEVVLESEKSQHASRQGILKKRLSMEEVTNIQQSETRGRRSSLDITARSSGHHHHHHHGILKRKTSRSEDEDFNYTVEDYAGDSPPHGILKGGISTEDCCGVMRPILKRRSHSEDHRDKSRDSSPEPHHGILKKASDHSGGLSYSEGCLQYQLNQSFDPVKPILKKKSLSEESAAASSLDLEAPRPILKKKSSTESDEADEYNKPRKPILKSRNSSRRDSPKRGFVEGAALPQDLAAALNEVVQRRSTGGSGSTNLQRTKSAAAADSELASILMKRRSMTDDQGPLIAVDNHNHQNLDNETSTSRNNSSSPTPVTESIAERISRLVGGASSGLENGSGGAVPRRRAADRFRTQPVTFNEMVALN
ncbi:uncharacterized protein LOC113381307, partial [Ctenocephalides felis]|uniref:uncharacterized protein LOC113381307 n=1 Tax=Ctenocephalides felis TaxID=7515 RepID=UPI000E6E3941